MQVETHLKSDTGTNTSSCKKYAQYLSKDNEFFFSATRDDITIDEAIEIIDKNSKGGLKKKDAKWYAPMYALSEKEARFLVKKLFNKDVLNFKDLTEEEQKIYNQELVKFGKKCQDLMAKNFDREHLEIFDGSNLHYVGVVENDRKYRGDDPEVVKGTAKQGQSKPGFNSHIHIIQSRKANTQRKSSISPLAKSRGGINNLGKIGFDRNKFYKNIEEAFDEMFSYNRKIEETLEFKKNAKVNSKNNLVEVKNDQDYFLNELLQEANLFGKAFDQARKENFRVSNNLFSQRQLKYWEKNISVHTYFQLLEKRNLVQLKRENQKDFVFTDLETGKEIYVSKEKNKWNSFSSKKGGGIISAIQKFENKSWKDAVMELKGLSNYKTIQNQEKRQRFEFRRKLNKKRSERFVVTKRDKVSSQKMIERITSKFSNINSKHISLLMEQIRFKNSEGKEYSSIGMRNISGGYTVFNGEKTRNIGKQNLIFNEVSNSDTVLIFEKVQDYFKHINYQNGRMPGNDVVILNNNEYIDNLNQLLSSKSYKNIEVMSENTYLNKRISVAKQLKVKSSL